MKRTLVLGGPGAGKTTRLLGVMEAAIRNGTPPSRIAFVSFTVAAVDEARTRACSRFGLQPSDLPYFRTVHSLAFRELGLRRHDVLTEEHLAELSEVTGELFTGDSGTEGPAAGRNGDPLLTLDHYARATRKTLRGAWEDHGGSIEWYRLRRFSEAYALFKADRDLLDFTDMLERYVGSDLESIGVDVAIVDEMQDLTELQHAVIAKAFAGVSEMWGAGDDDQAIHRWAGAAEERFLSLDWAREVLPRSHRLPQVIFDLSQLIVRRIGRRFAKDQSARRPGGLVEWVRGAEDVDLSEGSWLVLARTRAQLAPLAAAARSAGVLYRVKGTSSVDPLHVRAIQAHEALRAGKRVEGGDALLALKAAGVPGNPDEGRSWAASELRYDASPIWHDALIRIPLDDREYYLSCMRRGESLTRPPRVRVETIHGAKGLEADRVYLGTDLTYRTMRGYEIDPDSENRVLYVGLTRALEGLYLGASQTAYGYQI